MYKKKLKLIRFLKPYVVVIIVITILNINIPLVAEAWNRERNPCTLIRPDSEEVCKIRDEIFPYKNNSYTIRDIVCVLNYVYTHLNYSYDWSNWWMYEYLPTLEQVIERGLEDCDGYAILACSILRSMDLDAWIMCGTDHYWIRVFTEDSYKEFLGPRPPALYMYNEKSVVYLMSDVEIVYNRILPVQAYVDETILMKLILVPYAVFVITIIPDDYKKDESFISTLKKSGFLNVSRHAWMMALSLVIVLAWALLSLRIPQMYILSLFGLSSIGVITVDRIDKKYMKDLCFAILFLVMTLIVLYIVKWWI